MWTKRTLVVLILGAGLLAAAGGCLFFSRIEAVLDVSAPTGVVPLTIAFSADASSSTAGISTVRWTFGNGDESYESSGTYTYEHAGRYTVTLTVRGEDGETESTTVEIVVEPGIWICDENLDRIYKLDMSGVVLATFDLPVAEPKGLAVAETEGKTWLFVSCSGGGRQRVLQVDPVTGLAEAECVAPAQDPLYLTYGASDPRRLWHVDGLSRRIYELNPASCQVLDSFGTNYFRASQQVGNEVFLQTPQGLCWDGTEGGAGMLWYLEGETGLLYAIGIDPPINMFEGTQLEIDDPPIAVDGTVFPVSGMDVYDGVLWVVDRDDHEIVQIDPETGQRTGLRIGGFPGANTSGLAIQR